MTPADDAALIAEYERLRHELEALQRRDDEIDARLIELEPLLPDGYTFRGDIPLDR